MKPEEAKQTLESTVHSRLYRCSCGHEFSVKVGEATNCESCGRKVVLPAFASPSLATISLANAKASTQLQPVDHEIEEDDLTGQKYGHFKIVERLGHGGMGAVYRALDESLQRYVALKVVRNRKGGVFDSIQTGRLKEEAVSQARLNHPNIVQIFFVGDKDHQPFLAMELVSGETLATQSQNNSLTFLQVIHAANQVVDALSHAAEFDVVHGDIKPSNMLLTHDGHIKLADFGLASRLSLAGETQKGVSGTPHYMAPELGDGSPPSIQSDMYALGITLFELSFGMAPFEMTTMSLQDILDSHKTANVNFPNPWPTDIPQQWQDILIKLLSKKPENRYRSYEELKQDLQQITPSTTTTANRIPRFIAYCIDMMVFMLTMSPGMVLLAVVVNTMNSALLSMLAIILAVMGPFVVTGIVYWLRTTPGRHLLQLRVTDHYGLPLGRHKFLFRCLLRNIYLWYIVFTSILNTIGLNQLSLFLIPASIFIFGDFLVAIFYKKGRSLHDLICGSKVVLATRE